MMNRQFTRSWVSPITCVTFVVVATTGLLLAFHIGNISVRALHEWIGYLFMMAGMLHLLLNLKALAAHFRERSAILASLAAIIISAAVFCAGGRGEVRGGGPPLLRTFDADGNGIIDADEIAGAATSLRRLDLNHDGVISGEELKHGRRGRRGPPGSEREAESFTGQ